MLTSNIKSIMKERKVTIRAMVADTGLSGDTISRARNAAQISMCSLGTLEIMAKYLGCKIKDLFDEE